MLKNSEIKDKLKEMIKLKKAENSILETINNNEIEIEKIQKNLGILNSELENITDQIEQLKVEKSQIAIFKVMDIASKMKEISVLKKKYKERLDEIAYLNEVCEKKLEQNSEIEKQVKNQYIVYQENEILMKAIEKINESNIELSSEFYARYVNQMNKYINSMFSMQNNTKLEEPNHTDLAVLLEILKKNEDKLKNSKNKEESEEKETKSTKKTTEETGDNNEISEKKTTRKKSTKNESEEKKTTTRKRATKTKTDVKDSKSEKNIDKIESNEKKKATRKKSTKNNSDETDSEEKKSTTRKRSTKPKDDSEIKEKKTKSRKESVETKTDEEVKTEISMDNVSNNEE